MLITRRSPRTKEYNQREIDVTQEQLDMWKRGAFIQHAMPNVSAEDREFIKTGYTPENWDAIFPPEAEEDEDD